LASSIRRTDGHLPVAGSKQRRETGCLKVTVIREGLGDSEPTHDREGNVTHDAGGSAGALGKIDP
jgi:hypothetical protein